MDDANIVSVPILQANIANIINPPTADKGTIVEKSREENPILDNASSMIGYPAAFIVLIVLLLTLSYFNFLYSAI